MNIEELLPFYALDALLPDEKAFVEAYLREHPERLAEVTEMATVIEALPLAADPIEPAAHVKQSLMNRISAEKAAQNASRVASGASTADNQLVRLY